MSTARLLPLLIFLNCTFLASAENGSLPRTRGFIGALNSKDNDSVVVDSITAKALKSGLTTVFLPIVYTIVFVVALPTNVMAIWVFIFRTKKRLPASIYMAGLALSDLLFVLWLPLKINYHFKGNNWVYGEGLCKALVGFFYANMYCSVLFITCLSVQRYWVIAHPLSQQSKNNRIAYAISGAVWISIWLSTTPLYLYDQTAKIRHLNITTCHDVNAIADILNPFPEVAYPFFYFSFMFGLMFLIPSLVIIVAYVCLFKILSGSENSVCKKRRKAVVLIFVVLVTFLVCFVPSNIMLIIHYSLLKDGDRNNGYKFYITTLCLASLNSCLDPLIYYFVSEDFRDNVKNTLLCRSVRQVERLRVSFSSLKFSKKNQIYMADSSRTQSSSC